MQLVRMDAPLFLVRQRSFPVGPKTSGMPGLEIGESRNKSGLQGLSFAPKSDMIDGATGLCGDAGGVVARDVSARHRVSIAAIPPFIPHFGG